METKGHPLKVLMAQYEINQNEIAQLFGKTTHTIKKWMRGQGSPSMADLATFAQGFGLVETNNLARDWINWIREKNNGNSK